MKKRVYYVTVEESRTVRYSVEAASEEEARELVEASDDADEEFGYKTVDSSWFVEEVEEA